MLPYSAKWVDKLYKSGPKIVPRGTPPFSSPQIELNVCPDSCKELLKNILVILVILLIREIKFW